MMWTAFLATWRAMLADKGALTLLFAGGVLYSFFYPLPYTREVVQRVPVAVVDQDRSSMSRQMTRFAMAHPALQVVAVTPELPAAQDLLWRGDVMGVLIIPEGLQTDVLAGRAAQAQVAGNGLYLMLNKVALNGLAEVVGTVSAGIELKRLAAATPSSYQAADQRSPIAFDAVPLFNVKEGYGAYVVPGVATLIVQQTLLIGMTMLFGTWYQRKTFPLPRRRTMGGYAGMLLAFASVVFLNCCYFFGFVFWFQDYPRGGNFGGMVLLLALFSLTEAAFGMLLAMLFRTRERGTQLMIATSMPVLFLAGLTWPVSSMPALLQALRWLLPSTAGIQGFVALNQMGASLHDIRHEVAGLLVLLAACLVLGWRRWRVA
ncbi:ABC transporter permease [Janthinobacterium psychrotolerans]|uniref:ABC-2 type transport system permease protein n=1 Tax=Janthinobacterium psychrotolerans TaxID=1747903 RepID=A0A1A7C0Q5_9BURK|nr:ABC transporter permease [Janthinobacterium psychrotolerans]OBV38584.1 ABC-2 type transport system permease protein [Janthinobacterium psychrotolerans]